MVLLLYVRVLTDAIISPGLNDFVERLHVECGVCSCQVFMYIHVFVSALRMTTTVSNYWSGLNYERSFLFYAQYFLAAIVMEFNSNEHQSIRT